MNPAEIKKSHFSSAHYKAAADTPKANAPETKADIQPAASSNGSDEPKPSEQVAQDQWKIFSATDSISNLSRAFSQLLADHPTAPVPESDPKKAKKKKSQAPLPESGLFPHTETRAFSKKNFKELRKEFPLLTLDDSAPPEKPKEKATTEHIVPLFCRIITEEELSEESLQQLVFAARRQDIESSLIRGQTIWHITRARNRHAPQSKQPLSILVLKELRYALSFDAIARRKEFDRDLLAAAQKLEDELERAGLKPQLGEPLNYSFEQEYLPTITDEANKGVVSLIWQCTAGIVQKDPPRSITKEHVSHVVQGLLSVCTPKELIEHLENIWKYLNKEQQLVANFMVKEVLLWDVHNEFTNLPMSFLEKNSCNRDCNIAISLMLKIKSSLLSSIPYQNYLTLQKWLTGSELRKDHKSFEELLELTLEDAEKDQKRYEERVKILARELKFASLYFLQNALVREFYDKGWEVTNQLREATSPTLTAHGDATNNLTSLIELKILQSRMSPILVNLLIDVAKQLCRYSPEIGLDLRALSSIVAAFATNAIGRLDPAFGVDEGACVTPFQKRTYKELHALGKMVSATNGGKDPRRIEAASPHTLPDLVDFKRKITPIYDGNGQLETRSPVLGKVLLEYLRYQREALAFGCHIRSDILSVLLDKKYPTAAEIYKLSLKLVRPKLNLDDLKTVDSIVTMLSSSLEADVLPITVFKKQQFAPEKCLEKILEWLTAMDQEGKARARKEIVELLDTVHAIFALLQKQHPNALTIPTTEELDRQIYIALGTTFAPS